MKKNLFYSVITVLTLITSHSYAQSNGGGTTVGDGGHVIYCNGKYELFDLYEYRINSSTPARVTLNNGKSANLNQLVENGMARIQNRFNLTENEFYRVKRAAQMLFLDSQSADQSWMNSWSFSARGMLVSRAVSDSIQRMKCTVEQAVVRPPLTNYFLQICRNTLSEFEYCFLTSHELFSLLKREQKACLAIHESLRFLPADKRLSEENLRITAAEICTEKY
jgi:hypothetical protein